MRSHFTDSDIFYIEIPQSDAVYLNTTISWDDALGLLFANTSLTSYNFIFLPIVVLFWLYYALTRTANFVNFFNINSNSALNDFLKVKVESFSSFFKQYVINKLKSNFYKAYILFLLSI